MAAERLWASNSLADTDTIATQVGRQNVWDGSGGGRQLGRKASSQNIDQEMRHSLMKEQEGDAEMYEKGGHWESRLCRRRGWSEGQG